MHEAASKPRGATAQGNAPQSCGKRPKGNPVGTGYVAHRSNALGRKATIGRSVGKNAQGVDG